MRKEYTRPELYTEEFVTNEYIAACWNIACNVNSGYGYFEKNGQTGYQRNSDQYIDSGHGCGTMHVAHGINAAGPSANAMWQETDWFGNDDGAPYAVFYFNAKGGGDSNHHFCTLNSANWEANPNASN